MADIPADPWMTIDILMNETVRINTFLCISASLEAEKTQPLLYIHIPIHIIHLQYKSLA